MSTNTASQRYHTAAQVQFFSVPPPLRSTGENLSKFAAARFLAVPRTNLQSTVNNPLLRGPARWIVRYSARDVSQTAMKCLSLTTTTMSKGHRSRHETYQTTQQFFKTRSRTRPHTKQALPRKIACHKKCEWRTRQTPMHDYIK